MRSRIQRLCREILSAYRYGSYHAVSPHHQLLPDVAALCEASLDLEPVLQGVKACRPIQQWKHQSVSLPLPFVYGLVFKDIVGYILRRQVASADAASAPAKGPGGHPPKDEEPVSSFEAAGAPDASPHETDESCVPVAQFADG